MSLAFFPDFQDACLSGGDTFQAFSDVQIDLNKPHLYQDDLCPYSLSHLTAKSWLDWGAAATGDMAQGCTDTCFEPGWSFWCLNTSTV